MAAPDRLSQHEQILVRRQCGARIRAFAFELRLGTYKDGQKNRGRKTAANRFRPTIHSPEKSVSGDTQPFHVRLATAQTQDHAAMGIWENRAGH